VSRSWKGSGEDLACRDGMAEAASTVGFALMSSGILVEQVRPTVGLQEIDNRGSVSPEDFRISNYLMSGITFRYHLPLLEHIKVFTTDRGGAVLRRRQYAIAEESSANFIEPFLLWKFIATQSIPPYISPDATLI
jgi:hypothetical protein